MTPVALVEVQRTAYAIAAAWELGMEPPIPHPVLVVLVDPAGAWVGEVPAVNPMCAANICRAASKAGWHTRTEPEDGCE